MPATTGSGASTLVTARSASFLTFVVVVAELFPGHGSKVPLVAVTVLLSVVVLSEQVKPAQIAGVCLVIGGLVLLAR